ncbi:hypothetical protein SDC9_130245 [bioreactor metagenome]|uniref:Uncharacterized protein n=1 Tax=bioreactor metagenome TaxID=1076179 RepID=A0A645D372_9ZZZZ
MNCVLISIGIFVDKYLALTVIPAILFDFTFLTQVKWRSGNIDVTVLDKRFHIPEKESQDKCGNVASVHVGIGHDYHLMVPEFFDIQRFGIFFRSDSYPQGSIYVPDLFIFINPVGHHLLHVQDFST